jgi:hypothetical protein
MFDTLEHRTYGEVIMGFCNCVEAEIKRDIVLPLMTYLDKKKMSKNIKLETSAYSIKMTDDIFLDDIKRILLGISTHKDLRGFLFTLIPDQRDFLTKRLPNAIDKISYFRNIPHGDSAAHGGITNNKNAQEIRQLVLGTNNNPGLLKELIEIRNNLS